MKSDVIIVVGSIDAIGRCGAVRRLPSAPAPRDGSRCSRPARTGVRRAAGCRRPRLQVVAAENFWGSIAGQLGGDHVEVTSIINNPDTDPHDYEPTPADARAIASGGRRDRQRHRLRPVGAQARRRQPDTPGQTVLDVGDLVGVDGRRQPAPLVQPRRRAAGRRPRSPPTTSGSTPPTRRTSRSSGRPSRPRAPRAYNAADRRDQGDVRGHADRRVGEHLRDARAGARPRPASTPARLPRARSARATTRPRRTRRPIDEQITRQADQGVRLQQPERDARRAGPGRRGASSAGIPVDRRSPRRSTPADASRSRTGRRPARRACGPRSAQATGR